MVIYLSMTDLQIVYNLGMGMKGALRTLSLFVYNTTTYP